MQPEMLGRVAVIGAGLMGHGIAQIFAAAGHKVALHDAKAEALQRAIPAIDGNLNMLVACGALPTDRVAEILGRITVCAELQDAAREADLVIESVSENLELKRQLFRQLSAHCPPQALLCTNSSSIMPSQLARETRRPANVAGLHFFNPPALVPLVEVIAGPDTGPQVVETLAAVVRRAGKHPVVLRREVPGFLANRLQAALVREAVSLVDRGVASADDVDEAIRFGLSQRWSAAGIFELLDLAGLDTACAAAALILPDLDSSTDAASLRQRVACGELGAKVGRGFHSWTTERVDAARKRLAAALLRR